MKLLPALATVSMVSILCAAAVLAQSTSPPATAGALRDDPSKTPILTRAQFDQLLAKPQQLVIIDSGSLGGALSF